MRSEERERERLADWEIRDGGIWDQREGRWITTDIEPRDEAVFAALLREREPDPGRVLFWRRCGWCGAYEGEVDPTEPCAQDETGYIGPHQFGPLERASPPEAPEAGERDAEAYCTYCGERIANNEHALRLGAHLPCIGLHVGLWPKRAAAAPEREAEGTKQVMPSVGGQPFWCPCGCNVFTEYAPLRYRCNACGQCFEGEAADSTAATPRAPVVQRSTGRPPEWDHEVLEAVGSIMNAGTPEEESRREDDECERLWQTALRLTGVQRSTEGAEKKPTRGSETGPIVGVLRRLVDDLQRHSATAGGEIVRGPTFHAMLEQHARSIWSMAAQGDVSGLAHAASRHPEPSEGGET